MKVSENTLRKWFGEVTLQRGKRYFREGKVLSVGEDRPGVWRGEVRGSRERPYSTMVREQVRGGGKHAVVGVCSCPLRANCKHVVATLLAMGTAPQTGSEASATSVSAKGTGWELSVEHLERVLQAQMLTALSDFGNVRQLLYILRPLARIGRFYEVEMVLAWGRWQATESRFGALVTYTPQSMRSAASEDIRPLTPADHMALRSLALCVSDGDVSTGPSHPLEATVALTGSAATLAIQAAVATRRAYFDSVEGPPLQWGEEQATHLIWRLNADGSQTLDIDAPAAISVVTQAASVYIDESLQRLGRLQIDVPTALLPLVAQAPSVPLNKVGAFRASLPQPLAAVLPPLVNVECVRRKLSAIPMLTVGDDSMNDALAPGPLRARLSFVYGGAQTLAEPHSGSATPLTFTEGRTLVEVIRDPEAEARAMDELIRLGVRLDTSETRGWNWRVAPASDRQSLYAAKLHVLQPLQAKGWRIDGPVARLPHVSVSDMPWDAQLNDHDGALWFEMRLGINIEGKRHDLLPILLQALDRQELGLDPSILDSHQPDHVFLPLGEGRVVALATERLRQIIHVVQALHGARPKLGPAQALDLLTMAEEGKLHISGGVFALQMAQRLRDCRRIDAVTAPQGLCATLRPYQLEGLAWLQFLRTYELGGMLADDMGLGKTLQVLAHLQLEARAGRLQQPALVVAPTGLMFNWQAEARKFVPDLRVHIYHGNARSMQDADLVLTSYGVMQRDIKLLTAQDFHVVVLDEAHVIKNPRGKQHAAAMCLKARHRVALTGTPLQNNLAETWAQFSFLLPGLLDDFNTFRETFAVPIEKHHDPNAQIRLQQRIRPFILRRTKAEVMRDLPAKTETLVYVDMTERQRDLYETIRTAVSAQVRAALAKKGLARSTVAVLDALLKLRQVCCDSRLVKLPGRRSASDSAKLSALQEMVETFIQDGRRILIFSQFTSMLELIQEALNAKEIKYLVLTGRTRRREELVHKFQQGTIPVFLISLKAGGVGLNLTAADAVIHYDPWWNPAIERQATDRAHRMGQDKPVFVYKMIARGTLEERIAALQGEKAELADAFLGSERIKAPLSDGELLELLSPLRDGI